QDPGRPLDRADAAREAGQAGADADAVVDPVVEDAAGLGPAEMRLELDDEGREQDDCRRQAEVREAPRPPGERRVAHAERSSMSGHIRFIDRYRAVLKGCA